MREAARSASLSVPSADSDITNLREDLGEWPIGDALAVRQAAADENTRRRALEQLACQPGLADAGRSDDGRNLSRSLFDRPRQRTLERLELDLASDEWGIDRTLKGGDLG